MKKVLLVIMFSLTGCTFQELIDIKKDPSILFEQKAKIEHGKVEGILMGKRKLGEKQICYYGTSDDNINGFSLVRDSCPTTLSHER